MLKTFLRNLSELFGVENNFFADYIKLENSQIQVLNRHALTKALHTSPNAFVQSKEYFQANCLNMLDFLEWYNLLDCQLLVKSIEIYASCFLEEWNTNVHDFKSVSIYVPKLLFVTRLFNFIFSCQALQSILLTNSTILQHGQFFHLEPISRLSMNKFATSFWGE